VQFFSKVFEQDCIVNRFVSFFETSKNNSSLRRELGVTMQFVPFVTCL